MNCYVSKIQKNVLDCYKAQCEFWKVDESVNPPKIELLKGKTVPMLVVQFVDMENFDFNENIYDHITIDSTRVFTLACVDGEMNVLAFANYYDGTYAYMDIKPEAKNEPEKLRLQDDVEKFSSEILKLEDVEEEGKLRQVIRNINNLQPEVILFCHSLKNFYDLNSFMYIKDGKIYVYRVNEGDVFELNEYVRQFFTVGKVRSLNNTAVPFIYQFYGKQNSSRRTGSISTNQNMICAPILK
jgi:hypothetical protein